MYKIYVKNTWSIKNSKYKREKGRENNRILKRVLKINFLRHEANLWI